MEAQDLCLRNAHIITMNPQQPLAEAIAIRNGRIAAIGNWESVQPYETSGSGGLKPGDCCTVPIALRSPNRNRSGRSFGIHAPRCIQMSMGARFRRFACRSGAVG